MNRKKKEAAVKAALNKPFEVGDLVRLMSPDGSNYIGPCKIMAIDGGKIFLDGDGSSPSQSQGWRSELVHGRHNQYAAPCHRVQHYTSDVGASPYRDNWRSRAQPVLYTLETMIHMNNEGMFDFDPCVTAENGEIHHYQRGLVWTLKQKRDLIETVYEGGDMGVLVLYQTKDAGYEIIDGKQRLTTLMEFVAGGFEDHHGNSFEGLSDSAQARFKWRTRTTCLILPHTASAADIISAFLSINDRGTKVSKAHIEKVKAIPV